jgi:hypothetical protein
MRLGLGIGLGFGNRVSAVAPPDTPTSAMYQDTSEDVVMSWDDVADVTWKIFRHTANDFEAATELVDGLTDPTYADETTVLGTTYYYWVVANNGLDSEPAAFGAVIPGVPPANTVAPEVTGSAITGQTLTVTNVGSWDGNPAPTYSYQWKRDDVNIAGATNNTYVLTVEDSGADIVCQVTATNVVGSANATSNVTGPIVFTPLAISKLTNWWNVEDLAAVGDGNPVDTWTSNVGALAMAQTGTNRPTYVANDGDGKPKVDFDGVDDYLNVTSTNGAVYGANDSFEIWMVVKGTSGATFTGLWTSGGITQGVSIKWQNTPRGLFYTPGGKLTISNSLNLHDDAWHTLRVTQNGATRNFYLDGTLVGNASTDSAGGWNTGSDVFKIGSTDDAVWDGGQRHVFVFNDPLSAAEVTQMNAFTDSYT